MENLISEEIAKQQFDLLISFYDVDLKTLGEGGKTGVSLKRKLLKAIRQGKIEIDNTPDDFMIKQTWKDGTALTYHELNGMAKVQMDRYEGQHERVYGLLAMLSKTPIEKIQKATGPDLDILEYLGVIFLAG